MPETATHADLVRTIILYAEHEFGGLENTAVREDAVCPMRSEKPPRIEGYVPDVFITDIPATMTLIGEAKTRHDVETDHSRRQISAFLSYLSKTPGGIFVLSVPLIAGPIARRLIYGVNQSFHAAATRIVVLDGSINMS